jgi:hypothetical protein
MRYRASTIALWVLNFAVKIALLPIEHAVSPASSSASNDGILLAIGLGIVAETLVVLYRALRTESTIVWQKGKDGAPHQTLPPLRTSPLISPSSPKPDRDVASHFQRDW